MLSESENIRCTQDVGQRDYELRSYTFLSLKLCISFFSSGALAWYAMHAGCTQSTQCPNNFNLQDLDVTRGMAGCIARQFHCIRYPRYTSPRDRVNSGRHRGRDFKRKVTRDNLTEIGEEAETTYQVL